MQLPSVASPAGQAKSVCGTSLALPCRRQFLQSVARSVANGLGQRGAAQPGRAHARPAMGRLPRTRGVGGRDGRARRQGRLAGAAGCGRATRLARRRVPPLGPGLGGEVGEAVVGAPPLGGLGGRRSAPGGRHDPGRRRERRCRAPPSRPPALRPEVLAWPWVEARPDRPRLARGRRLPTRAPGSPSAGPRRCPPPPPGGGGAQGAPHPPPPPGGGRRGGGPPPPPVGGRGTGAPHERPGAPVWGAPGVPPPPRGGGGTMRPPTPPRAAGGACGGVPSCPVRAPGREWGSRPMRGAGGPPSAAGVPAPGAWDRARIMRLPETAQVGSWIPSGPGGTLGSWRRHRRRSRSWSG